MIFQGPLTLPYVDPWLLLLAGVLVSIAFGILFKKHPKDSHHHHCRGRKECFSDVEAEDLDGNDPYVKVSFGASSKYLHADSLKSGQFFVNFGALEVYFDQVTLAPEGAEIFLDCSFGSIKLYVPRSWTVVDKLRASLGGVDNNTGRAQPDENAPRLTLTGNVQLGGVEIQYI
jgi:predicted membrane protein